MTGPQWVGVGVRAGGVGGRGAGNLDVRSKHPLLAEEKLCTWVILGDTGNPRAFQ